MNVANDLGSDRGATMILVAASLVGLFGFAALAVDVSGFYQTARVSQTTADFACLAGVAEIDTGNDEAIEMAHAYAQANWSDASAMTLPNSGNPRTATDGDGNSITYEAGYGSNPDALYVSVNDRDPTTFGRVVGAETVDVFQEAACERDVEQGGPGGLPIAVLNGDFPGQLHLCFQSQCGALDVGSGASAFRDAVANGWDQPLVAHHGNGSSAATCPSSGTSTTPCSLIDTQNGAHVGPLGQGLVDRFSEPTSPPCPGHPAYNCDSMATVFGPGLSTLQATFGATPPGFWESSLYGDYASNSSAQYYFNGDIAKCDSPRLAMVPIISFNTDWDIDGPHGSWVNGKKTVKVIGFYLVYISTQTTPAKYKNKDPIVAHVVYPGPSATCGGNPISLGQTGVPIETVKLIQP